MRGLVFALLVVSVSAGWTSVYKFPWTAWPLPISLAVACPNTTTCFVLGGTHSSLPQVYISHDGFKTVTSANDLGKSLLLIDLAFSPDGQHGVAAGVGLVKVPAIQYTKDAGATWQSIHDEAIVEANAVYALGGEKFAYTGIINGVFNVEGVAESSDGGVRWEKHAWSTATKNAVPAGCAPQAAQFMGSTWFVACGTEPQEQQSSEQPEDEEDELKTITLKNKRYELIYNRKHSVAGIKRLPRGSHLTGNYTGAILMSTDAGKTYTVQYHEAGKYDVFDICCASTTNCVATASGTSAFGATMPGAYILATMDGKTWNVTASYAEPTYVYKCEYEPNTKTYWVGAGYAKSDTDAYVYTLVSSDSGKTWAQKGGQLKGMFEILDFNFVGGSKGTKAYGLAGTIDNIIAPIAYDA